MKHAKFIPALALVAVTGIIATSSALGAAKSVSSADEARRAWWTVVFNPCYSGSELEYSRGYSGESVAMKEIARSGYALLGWSTEYNKTTKMGNGDNMLSLTETYTINGKNQVLYAVWQKAEQEGHTAEEIKAYMDGLKSTSEDGHLYVHYYRWLNDANDYADWDVWSWPYRPHEDEGYNFEFGSETDTFGGATCDIDLTKNYDGGWNNGTRTVGGTEITFKDASDNLDTQVGIQIVKKATRQDPSMEFWANDGGNIYITLEDAAIDINGGGTAYHVFLIQDSTQDWTAAPLTAEERVDPFENDDGTNVTKGDSSYDNADWTDKQKMPTAPDWKGIGAGYQIMVASFADSDGDGFGDIYGITQKLDYLEGLGVKALWLTPIQKSDSYHGYDITDYESVDPKFGSSVSPAAIANNGIVTEDTAMADYEDLISKANAKGMKIVMDLVLNHTSTANKWFIKSAQLNEDYRGYYQWANHETDTSGIISTANCWYPYGDHPYSYYAKFGSGMPELNFSYQATRDAVKDMSLFWCEKGVEGFRLDAVKHIFMTDECDVANGDTIIVDEDSKGNNYSSDLTKNLNFYKELNYAVKSQYPNVFFVGENFDGTAYQVGPYYEAFDSMFDFYTYFNLTSMAAGLQVGGYASDWMRGQSPFNSVTGKEYNISGLNKKWSAPDVFHDYSVWRGDDALPGCFTSNHDIARTINRIAGTGNSQGLQAQGEITTSNFDTYNKKAMVVKLAEIFMPGVTWIYYGDEIGMTGNFLMNATSAEDDYSDLAYRQPMKWVSNGSVGDGSMTVGYGINGAKSNIYWDDVNSSAKVSPATVQAESENSDYSILARAIKLKNADPSALITGSFADANSQDRQLIFNRVGGGNTYKITADFENVTFTVTKNGSTVFSY